MMDELMISYRGDEGEYNEEFWMEKDENCPYCGTNDMQTSVDEKEIRLKKSSSFEELHMIITNTYGPYSSIWTGMTPLYAIVFYGLFSLLYRNLKHFALGQNVIDPKPLMNLGYMMEMSLSFTQFPLPLPKHL